MDKPLKILVKLPSRGRPEKLIKALDSIVDNIQDKENTFISLTLDTDDDAVNNEAFISRVRTRKANISIEWGLSTSKINAVNRSIPDIEWDVICIGSDDIFFNFYGFDSIIRAEMGLHFPDGDGYLHFHEKDSGSALCVMTVCDKKYYSRFNYIYHPEYLSLFADNHQMDVAKLLGRYVYIPYAIMEHRNPAYTEYNEVRDSQFDEQQKIGWSVDMAKYEEMKKRNYDL
ncbi:MAG: hypothetical protein KA198_08840 [Chitinophagaceae bacterium]|nr:hypothetical protein [Chitinophagaceae bacterium]